MPGEFVFYFPRACFEFCFLVCFPCCFLLPPFLSPPPFAKQAGEVPFCFLFCFLFCFQLYNAHISGFPRSHVSAFPQWQSVFPAGPGCGGGAAGERQRTGGEVGEGQSRNVLMWEHGNAQMRECGNVGMGKSRNLGIIKLKTKHKTKWKTKSNVPRLLCEVGRREKGGREKAKWKTNLKTK